MLQAGATAVVAFAPNIWVAVPAMFVGGMAWITVANSLTVSAQLALPDWVRARGMSIYQMAIMGAQRARRGAVGPGGRPTGIHDSLAIAAVTGVADDGAGAARWWPTAASRRT